MQPYWAAVRSLPQRERFATEQIGLRGYETFLPLVATKRTSAPLFVGSGAQNIALNAAVVADPTLIAAASSSGAAAANDGSNAQTMAELGIVPTGPDVAYQNLIQSVGSATQALNAQVGAQTSVANQAQAALSSATGVNLDTELTNLMSFQQNYEASAKLLSTISQTMQSLISAV